MNQLPIAIPGNCFNPKGYVKSHPASGLLSTRHGDRLIAVPELLLRSIPKTLRAEAGEASYLALYTFGENWGKTFGDRVLQDIAKYYREPILDTIATEFFVNVQEAWAVHGLGQPSIDFNLAKRGLLVVTIANSGIAGSMSGENHPTYRSFSLEAGFLAGWFSRLTNKNLGACASNWSEAPKSIQFLVGGAPHIETIERSLLQEGMLAPSMLNSL
jgi:predicted hydrocarbon binding protein